MTQVSTLTPEQNEILDLRDKVADLEDLVANLRAALDSKDIVFPLSWNLTRQESAALRSLYTSENGYRSNTAIHQVIAKNYATTAPHIVQVTICRLRKNVRDAGIIINTRRGDGYELPAVSREIVRRSLVQMNEIAA